MSTMDPKNIAEFNIAQPLRDTDVMLGRGSGPADHEGNITFRQQVDVRKQAYNGTTSRSEKMRIASEIVAVVERSGGRFVYKEALPNGKEILHLATRDVALEKAKQALRQNAKESRGQLPLNVPPKKSEVKSKENDVEVKIDKETKQTTVLDEFAPLDISSEEALRELSVGDLTTFGLIVNEVSDDSDATSLESDSDYSESDFNEVVDLLTSLKSDQSDVISKPVPKASAAIRSIQAANIKSRQVGPELNQDQKAQLIISVLKKAGVDDLVKQNIGTLASYWNGVN